MDRKMREKTVPKVLAVYLPQFYENEDNNRWWGKGFTDWKSVKTAEPYFTGHQQPKIPLHDNYYDLSQKRTMERQAELAREYGISAFSFYHYYFKDGKKELELPAENLLKWTDIQMPFCFNWASESWIRSWSRISGNVWAERYETGEERLDSGVLAEQDYGTYADWVRHFEYLLPFFKDNRYIKKDGKPVFIFYSPEDIACLKEMTECWRALAVKEGLPGIYLIGARLHVPSEFLDAGMIYEPRNSMNQLNENGDLEVKNGVRCFHYQSIWETITQTGPLFEYRTYFCGVSGYDDTPRRGKSGECLINSSPAVFEKYLIRLLQKSIQLGNEFLFINAWNEWGEGMYLEPDEREKYEYLEAVRNAIDKVSGIHSPVMAETHWDDLKKEREGLYYNLKKFKGLFDLLDKWLFLEQENKCSFLSVLANRGIETVAIYGMASLGKHLLIQLKKEKVQVSFGIDRYVGQFGEDFKIYRPEEAFPEVDAIIITAFDVEAIEARLRHKYVGRILGVGELIDEMMRGQ